MHFTWELNFHGDRNDIQIVLIDLNLLLVVGHGGSSLEGYVLLIRILYSIEIAFLYILISYLPLAAFIFILPYLLSTSLSIYFIPIN